MRRGKTQISKIRNAKGEITTNTMEIQEIIRDYFENLYSNKFNSKKGEIKRVTFPQKSSNFNEVPIKSGEQSMGIKNKATHHA
jgi:hypothetical protein